MYDYHNTLRAGHAASSPWWAFGRWIEKRTLCGSTPLCRTRALECHRLAETAQISADSMTPGGRNWIRSVGHGTAAQPVMTWSSCYCSSHPPCGCPGRASTGPRSSTTSSPACRSRRWRWPTSLAGRSNGPPPTSGCWRAWPRGGRDHRAAARYGPATPLPALSGPPLRCAAERVVPDGIACTECDHPVRRRSAKPRSSRCWCSSAGWSCSGWQLWLLYRAGGASHVALRTDPHRPREAFRPKPGRYATLVAIIGCIIMAIASSAIRS